MARRSRYLWALSATLAGLLTAAALLNLLIDPYGYFSAPRVNGLNAVKPQPGVELAAVKKAALGRIAPNGIILGNSRAEVGFDPMHPAWQTRGLHAYNAALPGAGLDTAAHMLKTAGQSAAPRVVIMGLDFLDFLTAPDAVLREYASPAVEAPIERWRRWFGALLTLRGLRDSARTILAQYERYPESITERGFNPLLEYQEIAHAEGYYAMFRQRAAENARIYVRKPQTVFTSGTHTSPAFESLGQVVRQVKEADAELHLVIYPYHAQILVMFEAAGLWPAFEQWKRRMAEIAAAGGSKVSLWDFSGFSEYATETIPAPNDRRTEVRWYWEAGHFKKELGDRVLDRVLGPGGRTGDIAFGSRPTPASIDQHLLRIRNERDAFRAANTAFVVETETLVANAR